jgi:hypothetical protein
VKPRQKVSSPFDLPILPIARTLLVKKGKKEKKVMRRAFSCSAMRRLLH